MIASRGSVTGSPAIVHASFRCRRASQLIVQHIEGIDDRFGRTRSPFFFTRAPVKPKLTLAFSKLALFFPKLALVLAKLALTFLPGALPLTMLVPSFFSQALSLPVFALSFFIRSLPFSTGQPISMKLQLDFFKGRLSFFKRPLPSISHRRAPAYRPISRLKHPPGMIKIFVVS